jgi:hypothetical protein
MFNFGQLIATNGKKHKKTGIRKDEGQKEITGKVRKG